MNEMESARESWLIVFVACATLIVLAFVDGVHLYSVNSRLRETVKMAEQASEAKTQFLSAMSHDIRTPLNAVIGMTTIAKKNTDNPEYVEECLDKTLKAGKQLLTLINDVLDISKIESGKLNLNPESVNLERTMSDLIEMQATLINEKKIDVECDISNLPYKNVYVDPIRLNQIFINLLSNAVKYTQAGGKIKIHMHDEDIEGDNSNTRLVFSISDNGIGMTEEFQKNMYGLFSREVSTQVNRTQGSGLGLSIVRQIVDLLEGKIECDSVAGEGTKFTVYLNLPKVEIPEEKSQDEVGENVDLGGMHLLVAEDNELNWEIIEALLSELNIVCDRAENGKKCIEILREAPEGTYDGILMDIQMPVMSGIEAAGTIRSLPDEKMRNIPIVAMTADAFAENVQQCLASGMNGHIAKPIDMNNLLNYLRKIKTGRW